MTDKNKKLQKKLEEILPEGFKNREGKFFCLTIFYSVIRLDPQLNLSPFILDLREKIENNSNSDLQNIMNELESLKSYLNNVELQLYEANEHISELLEKVFLSTNEISLSFFLIFPSFRTKRWKLKI